VACTVSKPYRSYIKLNASIILSHQAQKSNREDYIRGKTKPTRHVMSCTLAFSKNDFSFSSDKSKLSYTLKGFLNHFEINALFLSSRKRSSNSTITFTLIMVKMVKKQYQINHSSTIDHTAKRGKDKETKQLDSNF